MNVLLIIQQSLIKSYLGDIQHSNQESTTRIPTP